ncbi:MAG: carbon-phosphorus lyase complex subunit PhnI, partial [Treponema sp.]|nr:carbon-phosphorus lyase complex subunit PhnI [Treponema sp.]
MAYVAVSGGGEAVDRASSLVEEYRLRGESGVETEALEKRMSLLIDRIMGEAGFYAPHYAALALKQSEGSPEEAVFLLRAYRSTLTRAYRSIPLDGADMDLHRRISAAFKDISGGQFLGATYDYTHRLLDFENDLIPNIITQRHKGTEGNTEFADGSQPSVPLCLRERNIENTIIPEQIKATRVSDELRKEGLIATLNDDSPPMDITQHPISFPAPRSARLQALARADSGFVSGLAYAAIRGFGPAHPTVGELRTGTLEVL